jgi:spore photoproduct lyase
MEVIAMFPEAVYFEPEALSYPLGRQLREKYAHLNWMPVESHNAIPELQKRPNADFPRLKKLLIVGVRKTHKYVVNHKVSDFLVPYTSSGCSASCLYCYLVCNYNKCSYLRVFVNRERMMDRLVETSRKAERPLTFEIGSTATSCWKTRSRKTCRGRLRNLPGGEGAVSRSDEVRYGRAAASARPSGQDDLPDERQSEEIIRTVEYGTSPLAARLKALDDMNAAGYKTGFLIAPVILQDDWRTLYDELIQRLAEELSDGVKKTTFIEVIFMTYSYVQNAINTEAFPNAPVLLDRKIQTGRGRGKYCYRDPLRAEGEAFFRERLEKMLPEMPVLYFA